jgi:pimeloyl-ACP methyl ester carboxylesterase
LGQPGEHDAKLGHGGALRGAADQRLSRRFANVSRIRRQQPRSGGAFESELPLFSGRTIDVPSIFISGQSDWGVDQRPGALERMQDTACTRFAGCHLLEGAGHWVQREQAARVSDTIAGLPEGRRGVAGAGHGRPLPRGC